MTSPWAPIALTYNAIDIQDADGIHLEITAGLNDSPTVRGIDVTVPGADGQVARPRKFHERRVLLSGFVRGDGATESDRRSDYQDKMTTLVGLFDVTAAPVDLVATLPNSAVGTIAARALSVACAELVPAEFANVSIELLAVEDWSFA